jgi:hypothetical protein
VAALDIGWVSAATEADIIDLAGLTDPTIASLPGGHTSKRIDAAMLLDRDPDVLLLYAVVGDGQTRPTDIRSWRSSIFPRVVEARLAASDLVGERFTPRDFLPLGKTGAGYFLLERVR